MEVKYQLFISGLGRPASRCIRRTALRYCLTEEKHKREAKKAIYRPRLANDIGTGSISIAEQN